MWNGPYDDWGSRKHLISGIDQSLKRLQLDYVDIFYHHRPDPQTPLEETAEALATKVRALNDIAANRGQTLAQMAMCWNLSKKSVASVLIGASRPQQIIDNAAALTKLGFSEKELTAINAILI